MKRFKLQRLSIICATGLLSTGLLLSGCSNNDNVEADNTNAATTTDETVATATPEASPSQNDPAQTETVNTDSSTSDTAATVAPSSSTNQTASSQQKSLVTNPTQAGTPEDTVKQALDSLYQGDVKKSAGYYKVDMANFEEELGKTQSAFEQTVDGVTITDTKYNADKTRATITGELMLRGQSEPAPLTYELQKIDGQWKILG